MSAAVADSVRAFLDREQRHFIDGQWVSAAGEERLSTENPANGQTITTIPAGTADDVDRAVRAARQAFDSGTWGAVTPAERTELLLKLADAIEANADEIATIESLEGGMPLTSARGRAVVGAVASLRYHAGWATKLYGETSTLSAPGDWLGYTLREPVGVAALIVPWNAPLMMVINKIGPAIAAGCTVVIKPSEMTSLSALRVMDLVQEVGFPPGVINLVTGLGSTVGQALIEHPGVDKVSFTGSTATGRRIIQASAGNFKRLSLELGGKSPTFVFADADLEQAIPSVAMGIFGNTGQVCAAGSRLYVQREVFDEVMAGVADRAKTLVVGDGMDPRTEIGPVISATQRSRVLGYIDSGLAEGAELLVGGGQVEGPGYFVTPTVFTDTRPEMRIVREEIFGPVLGAVPFDDPEDLETLAAIGNDTDYGLNAAVWTRDMRRGHQMAKRLRSGTVRLNSPIGIDMSMPFGGYKQSGWGREQGRYGVEAYTEVKSVFVGL